MKVLLVTADVSVVEAVKVALVPRLHEVRVVGDIAGAVEALEPAPAALVVVDPPLPDGDVAGCCRRIRASPRGRDAVILALLEENQPGVLAAALDAGADDFHVKSIGPSALQMRLLISERVAAFRSLLGEQATRLRLILESGVIGITVASLDGTFMEANDVFLNMIGYSRQELEAGRVTRTIITPPDWHERDETALAKLRTSGALGLREKEYVRKDGTRVPVLVGGAKLDDDHALGVIADISERKRAEEELVRERDALDRFFTLSLDMLCIAGVDGYFKRVNPAFGTLGYSQEEICSRPFVDFVHPDDKTSTLAEVEKLARGVPTISFENRYRCKDGSYRWLLWSTAPDSSGTLYAVARDITDRKKAEEALRRSDEAARQASQFLEAVIENIPNMVFVKEAERLAFVRFNRAGEDLIGVPRAELLGKTDYDLFPKAEADYFQARDREALGGATLVDIPEEPIQTRRGQRLLHTKKVPIADQGGTPRYLLGISEDITERRAVEEARARLAAIVHDSEDAIIGRTLDGTVTSWNRSAERIFGFSAEEMIGQPIAVLFPMHRRDEEAHITERMSKGERIASFETVRRRKDGLGIDVSVTLSPIRDSTGKLIGVSKISRDITELKRIQRELLRAKETAEAANRELESFSYSVAHDLRAPLRSIDGFSQALLEDCGDKLGEDGRKHLRFVRESAQLMAQLIDDILTLSRVTRSELIREAVDLSALARAAWSRLERSEPGRDVEVVIQEGLVGDGDPRLLAVVFDNLIGNAWKFTAKRSRARIEFGATSNDGVPTYFVRDNGAGFDMTYASKLFGVFQRLHAAHEFEGTGVGLATVQRIVRRHGGRVWAEGKVDAGAAVYFTLGDRR